MLFPHLVTLLNVTYGDWKKLVATRLGVTYPQGYASTSQTTTTSTESDNKDNDQVSFKATFDQMQRNIEAVEAGQTEATWGDRTSLSEESDWISLRQFLLYLGTRYTPQSVFPFLELIPAAHMDESEYTKRITTVQQYNDTKNPYPTNFTLPSAQDLQDAQNNIATIPYSKNFTTKDEGAPGFDVDRWNRTKQVWNSESLNADLFSVDPFKEGLENMSTLSASGQEIYKTRGVGVRAYGQLVLNPEVTKLDTSKAGAIGFQDLEIQAGTQSTDGMAMISMSLVDVQSNKFTDINSPWSFIYDARPGSIAGDFYFRYGWQIRCPDPADTSNSSSRMFWEHPGWIKFGDDIKSFFIANILPSRPYITLTQSLPTFESYIESAKDRKLYALFDEGVTYDATTGKISIVTPNETTYVKISILNPEISMDENGALTAKLNFRTTGSITTNVPITYAKNTRSYVAKAGRVPLGQMILTIMEDMATFSATAFTTESDRKAQQQVKQNLNKVALAAKSNSKVAYQNLVYVSGLEEGGNTGGIDPDAIYLRISSERAKQLTNCTKDNDLTILGWFRQVLQDNECELLSAATGSGTGINSAWVIVTTQKDGDPDGLQYIPSLKLPEPPKFATSGVFSTTLFTQAQELSYEKQLNDISKLKSDQQPNYSEQVLTQIKDGEESIASKALDKLSNEFDVFSYRFQGTLCESINVEKTEAPNALKIAMDYSVSDWLTHDSDTMQGQLFNKPVSQVDKSRNLKIIFSQLQNCSITAMCHPWMGPGKYFFIKGMGFFDGKYQCLSLSHKMTNGKFTSEIKGARLLITNKKELQNSNLNNAQANGKSNITEAIVKQKIIDSRKAQANIGFFNKVTVAQHDLYDKLTGNTGGITSTSNNNNPVNTYEKYVAYQKSIGIKDIMSESTWSKTDKDYRNPLMINK